MVYRSDSSESAEKPQNAFRNDGSFLEMFKKLQEQAASSDGPTSRSSAEESVVGQEPDEELRSRSEKRAPSGPSKSYPLVGKRRGGRVLPTGKVKKVKSAQCGEKESDPKDAWSMYLAEVKRYKETTCEEDGKTRPLVK